MKKSNPKPPPPGKPRLGEIHHDDRGQAVWHWAVDTARNAVNSTSQLLRKLDLSELSLEEDAPPSAGAPKAEPVPKSPQLELAATDPVRGVRKPGPAGEFNPYKSGKPVAPARPARPGQRVRPEEAVRSGAKPRRPGPIARRPSWWRRLLGRG